MTVAGAAPMKLAAVVAALLVPAIAYADDPAPSRVAAADPASENLPPGYDAAPMPPGLAPVVQPAVAPPTAVADPMFAASKIVGAGHGLFVGSALTTPNGQIEIGLRSI